MPGAGALAGKISCPTRLKGKVYCPLDGAAHGLFCIIPVIDTRHKIGRQAPLKKAQGFYNWYYVNIAWVCVLAWDGSGVIWVPGLPWT